MTGELQSMSGRMKWLGLGLGIGFAVIALLAGILIASSRDIAPADTSDLRREIPDLAPEDNALTWFVRATEALVWHGDSSRVLGGFRDGDRSLKGEVESLLEENREALELAREGSLRHRAANPERTDFFSRSSLPPAWLNLCKLKEAEILLALENGDAMKAVEGLEILTRASAMIMADADSLIVYLVGNAGMHLSIRAAVELARDERTTPDGLVRLAGVLERAASTGLSPGTAMRGEHEGFAETMRMIADGRVGAEEMQNLDLPRAMRFSMVRGYLFQPERTILLHAERTRRAIGRIDRDYAEWSAESDNKEEEEDRKTIRRRMFAPNGIGWILADLAGSVDELVHKKYLESRAALDALRVVVALERHRRAFGAYPAELARLVPDYLESLPLDPFTGRDFRYDAERGVLFSAGPDLDAAGVEVPKGNIDQ